MNKSPHLHAGKKSAESAPGRPSGGGRLASSRAALAVEPGAARKQKGSHSGVNTVRGEAEAARPPVRFSFGAIPLESQSAPVGLLLERAVAGSRTELPQRASLEKCFGFSLAGINVRRNPFSREALEQFGAEAAVYRGYILLGDSAPTLRTLAHEVVHALQHDGTVNASAAPASAAPELAMPASEVEAESLSQRVERRVELSAAGASLAPLTVKSSLAPHHLALRRTSQTDSLIPGEQSPAAQSGAFRSGAGGSARAPETTPGGSSPAVGGAGAEGVRAPAGGQGAAGQLAPLEVPAPPAPGVTPEQVAAREQEMAEARAALEGADTASGVVDAFANAPPTLKAQAAGQLGTQINGALQQESQTLQENTPPVEAHLAHDEAPPAASLQVAAPAAPTVNLEPNAPAPAPPVSLPPTPEAPQFTANNGLADRVTSTQPAQENRSEQLGEALRDVRTTDPGITTSPGAAPQVPLEGETDPQRLQNQSEEGRAQARQGLAAAQQAIVAGPGPERVQPVAVDETHQIGELQAPVVENASAPEGAQQYAAMNLPPEVQTAFDQNTGEQMRASVGQAQGQMQQATADRDQQHQTEVQRAQTENDHLVEQSDEEQRARVTEARGQIQTERQNTLDRQQEAVAGAESEAEGRRTRDREAVEGRVGEDRQAIEGRYQEADREAQQRVSEGERDAETRRRDAERDAENQSWWDRAVNFIRDAFNALVSAIGAVFDAVRRAVNVVLNAARDFAVGLINAATRFITAAIAAFGQFLTSLVQNLLGDIFPGLAAALTNLIEGVVRLATRAVELVAAGLRSAVNTLVEGLRAGINAVLNTFQAVVNTGLAILRAAVTGDWGELARQVFEAVLRALGIDPAAVYQFIGRARGTLQLIIDDPGAFLGHVVDAVQGGIRKFSDNFLAHLQAGIIGWLTGAIGGAGITLPARFDLMGVLSIIQQILGLTWANIRQRAVRLVGERAVQVLEFVAGYVETLITGGWPALWERVQSDLATLRDMVLDQIKNFIVERLITAAITRLATMFNPVGALVNLVLTIYNFYTFLRDQMQRIFAVAQSIINAMSDIARGVIEPAATRVEGVLAGLLPLAIDLLARLIGLGNVGGRVREIIQNVQTTIWAAIDRLLDRILASFRGGSTGAAGAPGAGAPEGAGQIGERVTIPAGRESHTLYIEVHGRDAAVMIASEPRPLLAVLQNWRTQLDTLEAQVAQRASRLIDSSEQLLTTVDRAADESVLRAASTPPAATRGGTAAPGAPAAGAVVTGEQRLAVNLRELYPLFIQNTTTSSQRFERALSNDPFHQPFSRQQWQDFFNAPPAQTVGERQAQLDLAWGRENNRLEVLPRNQYRLLISDNDLVALAARLVAAEGRYIGVLRAGKLVFGLVHVREFCVDNERLPNDRNRYTPEVMSRIGDLLTRRGDVTRDQSAFVMTDIPSLRTLPDSWGGDDTREQFYINGSGFDTMAETVRIATFPDVQRAVTLLMSTDPAQRADGMDIWMNLKVRQVVPNGPFVPAQQNEYLNRASYDVDHITPLAQHWTNQGGNNTDEVARRTISGGRSNLRLLWGSINRARQAEGARYSTTVGQSFQSQFTKRLGFQFVRDGSRFKEYEPTS
jgi:phage-related protein